MSQSHYCLKLFLSSIMVSAILNADDSSCKSHTFFVPRQITTNSVFELALNNYDRYQGWDPEDGYHFAIYATPFYQRSSKGEKIARYFLRGGNQSLTFNEINEDLNALCSLWFGIESDVNTQFASGAFCMDPRRTAYGSYFNTSFANRWGNNALWLHIGFAAMRVKHELRIHSSLEEIAGPLSNFKLGTLDEFTSIIDALNNAEWNFGKFSTCRLSKGGVDDVQLKLGYDRFYGEEEYNHVSLYFVGTIPTGKQQRSEFIFEPLVGSKSGSIGAGINSGYTFYCGEKYDISWLFDLKYRSVFSADQCRSFDLCKNGEWSRYLLVVPQDQHLATQPGINLLSGTAHVRPGSTIDLWTALNWSWHEYNIEFGYNFWWRQKERVTLKKTASTTLGIFDLAGMNGVPQTASEANISQSAIGTNQAPSDASFVAITANDIDLDSAAHPAAFSSTVYVAFDWSLVRSDYTVLVGLGGQYEFAHRTSALEQWGIWGKLGLVFDLM